MSLSDADLRSIREAVGTTAPPTDDDLSDLWDELGSVPAVALAVLRPRLADALAAAAQGSLSVAGALSISAPAQPTMLLEQVQRLEAALAVDTGSPEPDALGGVTVIRRRDTRRGISWSI